MPSRPSRRTRHERGVCPAHCLRIAPQCGGRASAAQRTSAAASRRASPSGSSSDGSAAATTPPLHRSPLPRSWTGDLANDNHATTVADTINPDRSAAAAGPLTGPFQVSLTDPSGHVIAVQKFDRLEDAAAAVDAIERRAQPNSNAEPVVYAGQF